MGAARVCASEDCRTLLRRTNPGNRCELHRSDARANPEPPALSWLPPSLDPDYVLVPMPPSALKRHLARSAKG